MPKYKLKNGKYVVVDSKDMELFLASEDAKGAEFIEEKKATGPASAETNVVPENDTVSNLENGSSELPEVSDEDKKFFSQFGIDFKPERQKKPIDPIDIRNIEKNKPKVRPGDNIPLETPFSPTDIKAEKKAKEKATEIRVQSNKAFKEALENFLNQDLTEFGEFNQRFVKPEFKDIYNNPNTGITEGLIFKDVIRGRDISELSENPEFEASVRKNVKNLYEEANPNLPLPSNRQMDLFVKNAINDQIADLKEDERFEALKEKDFLIEQGEYSTFLNNSINADISEMSDVKKIAAKSRQRQAQLQNLLKTPDLNPKAKEVLLTEYNGLQKNYNNLLKNIDSDYKSYMDLSTGRRIDAKTAAELPSDQVADLSEEDTRLAKYYSSLPTEKLEQEYFQHHIEKQNYQKQRNKIYKTKPVKDWFMNNDSNDFWKKYTKNEDGSYNIPLKDYITAGGREQSRMNGVFDADTIQKMKRDRFYLTKDKTALTKKDEALETAYLLNVDPVSVSEGMNFGSGVTRFLEATSTAFIGEDKTVASFGTSRRKELDELESVLIDAGVYDPNNEEQKDELEAFKRSTSMKVAEGVAEFTPALLQFAVANKVAGLSGMNAVIQNLLKSSSYTKKTAGFVLGALLEEAKFKAVTGGKSQTGGGGGFYIGGAAARFLIPFRFASTRANAILEKVVLSGFGGATASEVALLTEAMYKEVANTKAFKTSIEEEFGSTTQVFDRWLTNNAVFGIIGGYGLAKNNFLDLKSRATKRKYIDNLQEKIDNGEFKGAELEGKKRQIAFLDNQIAVAQREFNKLDIASQKAQMDQARKIIAENKVPDFNAEGEFAGFKEATRSDIKEAENTIAKVQGNIAAAQRNISRQFENLVKSGVASGETLKLEITDKPLLNGDKAGYNPKTKTFKFDINSYKPGVFAQEAGHFFMDMAFKNDPLIAKQFKEKIKSDVESRFNSIGQEFTLPNKPGEKFTFEEAINEAYGKNRPAEEYVMNIVEFLQAPRNREILLQSGVLQSLKRNIITAGQNIGLQYGNKKDFTTGDQVLEFLFSLGKVAEGGNSSAIKKKFDAFKNIVVDGNKLLNKQTGQELKTDKEIEKDLASKEISPAEKKDIFSKATKAYEEIINSGGSIEQAGVMVGYEFQPLVKARIKSYMDRNGLNNIPEETINDIVSDVSLGTGKGSQNIPGLVKSYKESGEASLTSYVFGQLNNKILGVFKLPQYKDIFNTVSIDKDPAKAANIAEAEGLGGAPSGFVDVSSPIKNTRLADQQAETRMGVDQQFKDAAEKIGDLGLMGTKLSDLDAKSRGTIGEAKVAMLESNKARVTTGGKTEIVKARSPKDVQKKLGVAEKYKKFPTAINEITEIAKNKLVPEFERQFKLKDNYTATPEYENFIERSFPLFKNYISQSAVNKRFAPFKEAVIDKATGKQAREKTAAGNPIFAKKNITPEEWKEYFIGDGKMRIDGKRRSLFEALSTEIGFDKVMLKLTNESMRKQIESRQEDLGVDLVENYVALVSKSIDRGINTELNSKVIEAVKKGGGRFENVFFDKNGNFRPIDEIEKLKGGPEGLRLIEKQAIKEFHASMEYIKEEGRVNEDLIAKLKAKNIDGAELYKNIRSSSPESIEKFKSDIKDIVSYLPKEVLDLTSAKSSKTEGGIIASIMSWTSREVKATGENLNRESFVDLFSKDFGKNQLSENVKTLWNEAIELAKKNNLEGKGISITNKSRKFYEKASEISADKTLTELQQKEEINKLEGKQEAIIDIKVKEKILDALLATIGEIGSKLEGAELQSFSQSIGKMLLNNDGTGIRKFSSEKYIELNSFDKSKNEHLMSKAQFGAEVIDALLKGELNIEKVKEITSQYNSVIGSKKGQEIADGMLGTTIENAARLKMIASKIANGKISNAEISALKDFYNWTTGETAYSEMIKEYAEKAKNSIVKAEKGIAKENNKVALESELLNVTENTTTESFASKTIMFDKAFENAKNPNKKRKGISVFDFDDTLARTKSNVLYTMPDGKTGKLNATEFAKKSEALEAAGAKFDFSEFSKVVQGKLGPLFSEAQKKAGKFTTKDVFVLTARPANSAKAIKEFLKSEGLDIPLENIVGLGDGAPKAKSEWMVGKVAEGYNDFYFADDAIKNVKAVKTALDLFDVKSDVQQAIMASKQINLSSELNKMIERKKGIPARKKISASQAVNLGRKKGKFDLFLPPNAEDFAGMLYKFYGKGEQGNKDMALMKKVLLEPFNRAENAISSYRQNLGNDFKALEKQIGNIDAKMGKEAKLNLKEAGFNADQAVRVSIWKSLKYDIPGIKKSEIDLLNKIVKNDPRLSAYAKGILGITKTKESYPKPSESWFSSNIRYDLFKHSNEGARAEFLKEWVENVDAMFTPDNLNKIKAAYGEGYVDNLQQIIARMKSGRSRPENLSKEARAGLDYINGSVGVIMFLNSRSAILQTISAVNYLNWSDNNPIAVASTLKNPKQFAKTFVEIFNSDFLKQRRSGLEINVEEAEIAKAVERSKGKARYLYDALIKIGFTPTQLADSFAIAAGGTPFLINRTKTYSKAGLSLEAAKKKAFEDFRSLSEENQQSSRQDRVSNLQTGVLGRLLFAFNNTPMQMTRLFKKRSLDLINGRGDAKTNISGMVYYGLVQSIIFYAMQQARFLDMFGGDDEDVSQEEKEFNQKNREKRNARLLNSTLDGFLNGAGLPGKILTTGKNALAEYYREEPKGYRAEYADVINEELGISPPLSSKVKKQSSAFKTFKYYSTKKGKEELEQYGKYALDNPMLMARSKIFSSITNVPTDRILSKIDNLKLALTDGTIDPVKRLALAAGWDKWSLGFYDNVFVPAEEKKAKTKKNRAEGRKKAKETRERNKKRKEDSIINVRSKMTSEQILEDLRKELNKK